MITQFGWSDRLSQDFITYAEQGYEPGRVIIQQRTHYVVVTDQGELQAQPTGRFFHEALEGEHPAVGDWVAVTPRPAEGSASVHAVLPRRTVFVRKAADSVQTPQVVAANVDVAFLVTSMNDDFNVRRLERYLGAAWQSGAQPVIVLTKADLCADPDVFLARAERIAGGVPVLAVSAMTGLGMAELAVQLPVGDTGVLVGSSGAGKSTLVNALAGQARMSTGAIRDDDARGRHTTTHRELILLPSGALILDTPGMREFGMVDAGIDLEATFSDVESLAEGCRFRDCRHEHEPGCAVRAARETGALDDARWQSFQKLGKELAHLERKDDRLAREAERKRWISIAKAQRSHQTSKKGR